MLAMMSLVLAISLAAPQAGDVPADVRARIDAVNADWIPALQAHAPERIAAPYAEDGIFVTATGEVIKGREAVAQMMRERIARMGTVVRGTLVQDGITRQGGLVYEWGHAELTVAPREGGTAQTSSGRYLTVWRQGDHGRWEIVRNLSLPE